MVKKYTFSLVTLSVALIFNSLPTFAMVDPWEDALDKRASRPQLLEVCQQGMKDHKDESPERTLWISRFKAVFKENGSETLNPDELDSLRKLRLAIIETSSTESEIEKLQRQIREQQEQFQLLQLKKQAEEQQRLLLELEKEKAAPIVTPNAPVVTEHPEKAAEIRRIRQNLSNKSEREKDTLGRGLQKLDNHYDRKAQKKRNKWFWGIRKKDSHILKLYNQGQLDMTSPPKKQ